MEGKFQTETAAVVYQKELLGFGGINFGEPVKEETTSRLPKLLKQYRSFVFLLKLLGNSR